jgi:hypothetical protein
MDGSVNRIDLDGCDNVESSLLEAKAETASSRKQVYSDWPSHS